MLACEARLGGELRPFQRAGVAYALKARRLFIADEQGLGKTIEALAALEEDDAYPAVVICPASLKLNWERETAHWLPHRSLHVVVGTGKAIPKADITVLNYEIVHAHRERLAISRPKALILDESHYVKNPSAKRTRAVRRLAEALPEGALKVALTGTPVMNHPDELIAQLRILGRLEEFGSGARFKRRFQGAGAEERIHWHLRRTCFVRRLKKDVLPQLPEKRQVVVPVALENEREYRLAERDVVAWLQEQPLELAELEAKVASTLRAERLAQLNTLRRLAARGKLGPALAWIDDFLASEEPLVVFASHREIQEMVVQRFPDALHVVGADKAIERDLAVQAFQEPDGPQLIVCSTRVAGQGITLTRASNVAFLDLEWSPAMHDQAEDRLHRIGQRDAVTAWYLLAAESIDESMAEVLARKRGVVGAVTDGRRDESEAVVQSVVRALRGQAVAAASRGCVGACRVNCAGWGGGYPAAVPRTSGKVPPRREWSLGKSGLTKRPISAGARLRATRGANRSLVRSQPELATDRCGGERQRALRGHFRAARVAHRPLNAAVSDLQPRITRTSSTAPATTLAPARSATSNWIRTVWPANPFKLATPVAQSPPGVTPPASLNTVVVVAPTTRTRRKSASVRERVGVPERERVVPGARQRDRGRADGGETARDVVDLPVAAGEERAAALEAPGRGGVRAVGVHGPARRALELGGGEQGHRRDAGAVLGRLADHAVRAVGGLEQQQHALAVARGLAGDHRGRRVEAGTG